MITVNPKNIEPEDTLRIRLSTIRMIALILVAFAAGLGSGYSLWGSRPLQQPAAVAAQPVAPAAPTAGAQQRINVPVAGNPALGPETAAVTIIEFSDFECPFCQRWVKETWPQIQQAYPGQIRLVYRDFPLNGHPNAQSAAEAANCANEQGKFWPYHDKLLSSKALGQQTYLGYANELKLDMTKFQECLASRRYQAEVEADFQYGANLGINGTPTFFINGIPLVGAQPFSSFKKIIDQELAGK